MTSFAPCPLGAFRLVFDQISSFSWSSFELRLLFLYMKRVFYISAVVNFRYFSLSVADLDVSCVFYHFFGQFWNSCLHWNFYCVRPLLYYLCFGDDQEKLVATGGEKLNIGMFRPTRFLLLRSHMTFDQLCMFEIRLVGLILFGTPYF